MYGLESADLENIKNCFKKIPEIKEVIIYGSRAKDDYRPGSDIDITLIGDELNFDNSIFPLKNLLDELYLPYKFDISIFKQIDDENLIRSIENSGKTLYKIDL